MTIFFFLITLAIILVSIVLSLGIVWQSEGGIDHAFKFLTVGLVLVGIRQTLYILSLLEVLPQYEFLNAIQFIALLFTMIFLITFNTAIQRVWKKKR